VLGGAATKASKETATPQMGSRSSARHQGGAMREKGRGFMCSIPHGWVGGVKVRMAGKDRPAYCSRSSLVLQVAALLAFLRSSFSYLSAGLC
jgi:hypothetical protein